MVIEIAEPARRTCMAEARLDAALAERGIARSRTHAARLITDGSVTVDGRTVIKPSTRVTAEQGQPYLCHNLRHKYY